VSSSSTHGRPGTGSTWLTTDGEHDGAELARAVRVDQLDELGRRDASGSSRATSDPLAVLLHDLVIHDNQRWWGRALIRVDTVVLTGVLPSGSDDLSGLTARTFSFPRVADGEELSPDGGLLLFYGVPRFFLEIFVLVSRDRTGSADLSSLLATAAGTPEVSSWVDATAAIAVGEPTVQAISALASAALTVGSAAYKMLEGRTDATIGLYRGTWLQARDAFGLGPHPRDGGAYHEQDISFWYEVRPEATHVRAVRGRDR
jgi:hypothetical protein